MGPRTSHQLARTAYSTDGSPDPAIQATQQGRLVHARQHDGGGILIAARRDTFPPPPQANSPDSEAVLRAHSGTGQCSGGHGLPSGPDHIDGVDINNTGLSVDVQSVLLGTTVIGTVRESSQPHPPEVRVSVSGCEGMGDGRATVSMAAGDSVRIPSSQSDVEVPQETTGRGNVSQSSGSDMVGSSQVGPSVMHSSHSSDGELSNRGPASPTTALGPRVRASPSIGPPADTFGEDYLRQQGFSDSVIERIRNSRALSTRKHYRSQWELFVSWAVAKHLDPMNASLPLLTEFMDYLFRVRQVGVRTIANYKSAIAFHFQSAIAQCGYELPEGDTIIRDLLKGFKRERPIPHKHVVDWDIRLVLSFFQSGRFRDWSRLSDKELTLKTLFLVALATGKRRSELHALSAEVKWIKGGLRTAELMPVADFVSKTHMATAGLGALKPIVLGSLDDMAGPEGKEEKLLCPVRTLAYYLERSKEYRSECQKRLFISYRRGMSKDISKQTISAYLKEAILMAYEQKGSAMGVGGGTRESAFSSPCGYLLKRP